ncbi:MAG: CapA family protein [Myxococcales bacterium]|nr:CapA family protein [Myxococcales bacterium]
MLGVLALGVALGAGCPEPRGPGPEADAGAQASALPAPARAAEVAERPRAPAEGDGEATRSEEGPAIDLWIAGDLHLADRGAAPLAALPSLVPAGSSGILNLEGPIGDRPSDRSIAAPGDAPILTNGRDVPRILQGLGVAAVSVANNHAADLGRAGEVSTIAALRWSGVDPAGGDAGVAFFERDGIRLAVSAHDLSGGVPEGLAEALERADVGAHHLIVTFHVTGPPSYLPRPELREGVELALKAGAKVIAAHGSHALARVERQGDAVIAWGLGNLAFACRCTDEVDGAILALRLDRTSILEAEVIPIDAGLDGGPLGPASDPALVIDLLRKLGSSPGEVVDGRYRLTLADR